MNKLAAIYHKAQRQMQQFFSGICTVYALQAPEMDGISYGGFVDFTGWEPLAGWTEIPCQLALGQSNPAVPGAANTAAAGSSVEAKGRLFLAVGSDTADTADIAMIPAGSRLRVEQAGAVYWLACSGMPVSYPTHCEVEVLLLPERA